MPTHPRPAPLWTLRPTSPTLKEAYASVGDQLYFWSSINETHPTRFITAILTLDFYL
jgi:hypothetical protein